MSSWVNQLLARRGYAQVSVNEAMTDKAMNYEKQQFEDVTNFVTKAEESKMAHSLKGG